MTPSMAEFIGTMLLIVLGNGVVANVLLNKTKGHGGGWIVITFGWAIAVFVGVFASLFLGGKGHLNPAVTLAMAYLGNFELNQVFPYIIAQFAGAIAGSIVVWLAYRQHFIHTPDGDTKLAVFCNSPAIKSTVDNLVTEVLGTFVLVLGALLMSASEMKMGALDALPVGLLVLGIGLSLGGPTGYAINPARDLGPRIAHFLLPIPQKRNSDWNYSWIPVVGPIAGAMLAAIIFNVIK
ncbi:MAG: aquaporin family protein [Chitinophagaceae bacterium]|nr:aquaporin family protein [Chitinophagaceae bacterium]